MRWILCCLLFYSSQALAQKKLTQEAFQINVRPVLSGIINDFYQMISLFPDFPKELVNIAESMDKLTADKENLRGSCPRYLEVKCLPSIESLRNKLSELQERSFVLMAHVQFSSNPHITSLSGLRMMNDFQTELALAKGQLDNASFLLKAKIQNRRETYPLVRQLDELNTLISLTVVAFIPYTYQDDFRHFYLNFVHPIELQISKNKNYEFLNRNLNQLNFSLNLLNMNLTKRNKKTPEGMGPYLATIHNRWNSLLRYYF